MYTCRDGPRLIRNGKRSKQKTQINELYHDSNGGGYIKCGNNDNRIGRYGNNKSLFMKQQCSSCPSCPSYSLNTFATRLHNLDTCMTKDLSTFWYELGNPYY